MFLRIEIIFIYISGRRIFLFQKKNGKNSNIPNFNHHGSLVPVKVSTLCQGSYTLFLYESRFPHLAKVPTPCQGSHTLFLCESRFPHLAKVPTPCFYISQCFHTLPRFPHLVAVKVSTPCQGSHTL